MSKLEMNIVHKKRVIKKEILNDKQIKKKGV